MVGTAAGAEVPWKWGHAAPTLALGVRAAPGPAGSPSRSLYCQELRPNTVGVVYVCVWSLALSNEHLQKPGGTCGCRTAAVRVG